MADNKQLVYVVEEQANPSTDLFILPALMAHGCMVIRCGFADLPTTTDLCGAIVLFVRYVPRAWLKLVNAARSEIHRLIFFMDDDVLDVDASIGMPLKYRYKLARLAARRNVWLKKQGAEIWVSTPYLQKKYEVRSPRLILPSPPSTFDEVCRVFYHGTASHFAEIRWLRQVMEMSLSQDERLAFEIVGGKEVYRLYRDLPRVMVVHPMKWPAYQAFLAQPGRHIGLVPLLDVPFNLARSCTKFMDITRCGAVGIYASGGPCAEIVANEVDGLVVEQEPGAWVQAILRLSRDEQLRQKIVSNAQLKHATLANKAQSSYSNLF